MIILLPARSFFSIRCVGFGNPLMTTTLSPAAFAAATTRALKSANDWQDRPAEAE
jgi:hypothetical protein